MLQAKGGDARLVSSRRSKEPDTKVSIVASSASPRPAPRDKAHAQHEQTKADGVKETVSQELHTMLARAVALDDQIQSVQATLDVRLQTHAASRDTVWCAALLYM